MEGRQDVLVEESRWKIKITLAALEYGTCVI